MGPWLAKARVGWRRLGEVLCWVLPTASCTDVLEVETPRNPHFPRFRERQMRLEAYGDCGLDYAGRHERSSPARAGSRGPICADGGMDCFFVAGVTELRPQSSVVWYTSLQIQHGVAGESACVTT